MGVQDVLGINGGAFYGATYFALKDVRRVATMSFTDTASDSVQGITGDDCISSCFDGSDCDLGTLDYAAGVICNGWSANFLKVAIKMAHLYLSTGKTFPPDLSPVKSRNQLHETYEDFMDIPSTDGWRQYDEVQIHGQIYFSENVEYISVCKPFVPNCKIGKLIRHDGKLILINPVSHYVDDVGARPSEGRDASNTAAFP